MKFKGQIELENGYIMVMDFLALAEFEKLSGKKALETLASLEDGSVPYLDDMINLHIAALKRHQPNITEEQAADIMSEYPDALGNVIKAASPDIEADNTKTSAKKK